MTTSIVTKLRYMARQYTNGQAARGGNPPAKHYLDESADEIERLQAENALLRNALWKACGDDESVVNATIESQR